MRVRGSVTVRRLPPSPAVVIQAGARTFVKKGGACSPASIAVRAEASNVRDPAYEWGRLADGTFNLVSSWTGASITVLPEQAGVVMVKVRGSNIADPVSDYVDISVVEDGENGESLSGRMLHTDPTFKRGTNGVSKYSNASAEAKALLAVERVERPEDAPTTSAHCLRVTCKAEQSPGFGGVCQSIQSRANAVFVQKIIAKLPIGYKLNAASNSMGSGYTDVWLTSTEGTGKYETYLRKVTCGASGTFSTGGHLYVTGGPVPTEEAPLVWHIAYMTAFDQTDDGYEQIETASKDALAEKLGYGSWEEMVDEVASAGSIIQGDYIRSTLIDAETIAADNAFVDALMANTAFVNDIKGISFDFKEGKIGAFTIDADSIYCGTKAAKDQYSTNGITLSSQGYLSHKEFVLKSDGSATFKGELQASRGKIGGFTIGSGGLTYGDLYMGSEMIEYRDSNRIVYIGKHPQGSYIAGYFKSTGDTSTTLSVLDRVALYANAGTSRSTAYKTAALYCDNGDLYLRNGAFISSVYLWTYKSDGYIDIQGKFLIHVLGTVGGTGSCRISKTGVTEGQIIIIMNRTNAELRIFNGVSTTYSIPYKKIGIFIYSGDEQLWIPLTGL